MANTTIIKFGTPSDEPITTDLEGWKVIEGSPTMKIWIQHTSADGSMISGTWLATQGSYHATYTSYEFVHLIEGQLSITPDEGGETVQLGPGDAFVIEPGFKGIWKIEEKGNGSPDIENIGSHRSSRSLSSASANFSLQTKYSVSSAKNQIHSRTQRVTATLLLVSCSFLLLNSPYCAVWIANYVHGFKNSTLKSIKEITELFMLTNFCINFLLYCVSGKVFRSELLCLLRCQWKELYDRYEGERKVQRKTRSKVEIQLNEKKFEIRASCLRRNDQQRHLTASSLKNSKCLMNQRSSR
ncbi:unnamed protein product [Rotaria socialis]